MNEVSEPRTRKCISCGKELPAEASFCPYCEASQIQKNDMDIIPHPRRLRSRRLRLSLLAGIVIVSIVWLTAFRLRHRPMVYENDKASVVYPLKGRNYKLFLSFMEKAGTTGQSMREATDRMEPGKTSYIPTMLFVTPADDSEDSLSSEEMAFFASNIRSCALSASAREGYMTMPVSEPEGAEDIPACLYRANVTYGTNYGTNDLHWSIEMKNGDRIELVQTMTCEQQVVIDLHYEDTPLETTDQIEKVIEQVYADTPDAILNLYLPPVRYTQPLTVQKYAVFLYGCREGEMETTFAAPVTVLTRIPNLSEFHDIVFEADHSGQGTALCARESLLAVGCSFRGWDIGADAQDGSWIMLENCTFEGNRIGFRFDSKHATASDITYSGLVFRDNQIGMQILNVPGEYSLTLADCTFDGNQEDIQDPHGYVGP